MDLAFRGDTEIEMFYWDFNILIKIMDMKSNKKFSLPSKKLTFPIAV